MKLIIDTNVLISSLLKDSTIILRSSSRFSYQLASFLLILDGIERLIQDIPFVEWLICNLGQKTKYLPFF